MTRLLLASLCTLALVAGPLAACGDDGGGGGGGEADFEAASFEVDLPDRWRDATDSEVAQKAFEEVGDRAGFEVEPEAALVGPPRDRFAPNLIVIKGERDVEKDAPEYLRDATKAENEFAREHPDLAPDRDLGVRVTTFQDDPAVQREFRRSTPAGPTRERQIVVVHDGTVHYLSFTALEKHFESDVEKLDEILDSWRWK